MALQVPILSTRYTVINDGAGNSTPVEITIEDGCVEVTIVADGTNSGYIYLINNRINLGVVSIPAPTASAQPFAITILPNQSMQFNIGPASKRVGSSRLWLYGAANGDYLHVTQVIRNLR